MRIIFRPSIILKLFKNLMHFIVNNREWVENIKQKYSIIEAPDPLESN